MGYTYRALEKLGDINRIHYPPPEKFKGTKKLLSLTWIRLPSFKSLPQSDKKLAGRRGLI